MQRNESKYRGIVETNQFCIVVCNEKGYFIEVNQAFCDMLGYTKEEIYTKKVGEVTVSGGTPENIAQQKKLKTGELKHISLNKKYRAKNGTIIEARVNINGDYNKEGVLKRYYATIADLTERVNFERKIEGLLKEVKKSNIDLERSNRDLRQFASAASHDLQEPLRTIGSFVSLLEEENKDKLDEESLEYMSFVVKGVIRMRALIDALLEYSKIGRSEIKLEEVRPKKVIDEVLLDLSLRVKETNTTVKIGAIPETVSAEPNHISMVFYNLINNGIKFNKSKNPVVTIDGKEQEKDYLFSIKDNGIGIKSKNHGKIFEIFKRLHRREEYKGTGIGLASVKQIIEKHKGRIWLESELGEGTTFFFTIPKRPTIDS